ncbi:MAG: hypothetical protein IBX62_00550 [Coriobacteriia bacterium]|nr:hypothetical protein [Coriobacteriia bacterium]
MSRRPFDAERDTVSFAPPRAERPPGPQAPRLGAVRDTGILLGPPRARWGRRRRHPLAALLTAALLVAAASLLAWSLSARGAARSGGGTGEGASYRLEVLPDPTPVFATYRSLQIHLPLRPEEATAIAFHQASGGDSLRMGSLVPDADMAAAARGDVQLKPAVARVEAPEGVPAVLDGRVLRLWRSNRRGAPDTACDAGAAPGTVVYAPVSGTVAAVTRYELYGRHPDYEIHISPDGWPEVDVVLIHVDAVKVRPGDRVEAGATGIAEVRRLSDRLDHQLAAYTGDGGDHVHMQLNRVGAPGELRPIGGS